MDGLGGVDADRREKPFQTSRRGDRDDMQVVGVSAERMRHAMRTVEEVAGSGLERVVADEPSAATGDHEPRLVVDLVDVTSRRVAMSRNVLLHHEHAP